MVTQFFILTGAILGVVLLGMLERSRREVKNGPLGDFYMLYIHRYLLYLEGGIFLMAVSFLLNYFNLFENIHFYIFQFNTHNILLVLAMISFMMSARVYLSELERMLRHYEKRKISGEK